MDELASRYDVTRDSGPKENDELMDGRGWRELDGDGRRGIGGILYPKFGGGVDAIY